MKPAAPVTSAFMRTPRDAVGQPARPAGWVDAPRAPSVPAAATSAVAPTRTTSYVNSMRTGDEQPPSVLISISSS